MSCMENEYVLLTKINEFHLYIRTIFKNMKRYFLQHSFDLQIITINDLFRIHVKISTFHKKKISKIFFKIFAAFAKISAVKTVGD